MIVFSGTFQILGPFLTQLLSTLLRGKYCFFKAWGPLWMVRDGRETGQTGSQVETKC